MKAEFLTSPVLGTPHGFFTRRGGVSEGPFFSLNCNFKGGDDPEAVRQNRARAAKALGVNPEHLLGLSQVHGNRAVIVREPWPEGDGPQADAMVTDRPGLALGIITADCAPVLFADAKAAVIGAAHAGWRGAAAGVLEATLAAMQSLGARPERVCAVIGPCIGQDSYEVGADVRAAVLAHGPEHESLFRTGKRPGRWQFDLAGFCAARLARAGIGAIHRVAADTCAEAERFFSHRRRTLSGGGPIGHQISIIALAAKAGHS